MNDKVTVRTSDKDKDFYHPWSNGGIDLVSKGFRGNDA
jgi:hypothetical protein